MDKNKTIIRRFYEQFMGVRHRLNQHLPKMQTMGLTLTPESVVWAYRLFLDREPENQEVVYAKAKRVANTRELRQDFMKSDEFQRNNSEFYSPALSGYEPPMLIEDIESEAELQALFKHIQDTWHSLGETEPYWSVLSDNEFRQSKIEATKELFYSSGKQNAELLFSALRRHGIDVRRFRSCLEYGCGLGRVTRWLAERFEQVDAYDISKAHLYLAQDYLAQQHINNVTFHHIQELQELHTLAKTDVIYSLIVLQHNPPPIITLMIRALIRALNPGGVAFFQVPTYHLGYSFSLQAYLSKEATRREIEMHVVPQHTVFDIVQQEGATVIEVLEDNWTGFGRGSVSNTFLIQKL